MRVLHVVDTRQLRGAEVFASDLIRALNGTGISQCVCVLGSGEDGRVQYDAPARVLGANGRLAPAIRIRPRTLRGLRRLIDQWQPDVVQAHGGSTLKYTIPALVGRRTRMVYRQIGPTPPERIGHLRRMAYRLLMRRADRVVAVGEAVRRNVVQLFGVPADRLITISNAVDPRRLQTTRSREAIRSALGISPSSPMILSLGALTWEKDPIAHVEIGAHVLHRLPEAVHLMVGDGPMRREVESVVRRRAPEGRILVLGAQTNVADFLAASDVLLFASRADGMESMNASVIEAGMLGIPAAAYAVGGVPEIVVDRVTGRLTPSGHIEDLAAIVLELLLSPEASRVMGEAARKRYLSLYDIRTVAPQYLGLYKELVSS